MLMRIFSHRNSPIFLRQRQHQLVTENLHVDGSRSTTGQPRGRPKRWQAKAPKTSVHFNSFPKPDIKERFNSGPSFFLRPALPLKHLPCCLPPTDGIQGMKSTKSRFLVTCLMFSSNRAFRCFWWGGGALRKATLGMPPFLSNKAGWGRGEERKKRAENKSESTH